MLKCVYTGLPDHCSFSEWRRRGASVLAAFFMNQNSHVQVRFYEDSNFGKSDRRFYEDRLKSGRVTTQGGLELDLAVVADGIGGENAGERAAEMTIDEVFDCVRSSELQDIPLILQNALEMANAKVYMEAQRERHKQDMGSTAVVAAVHEGQLYIANVGDSRAYLVRGRNIRQLTWDHTLGNEMLREGRFSREESEKHPRRDELMRSIGYEPQVAVDIGLYLDGNFDEAEARRNQGLELKPGDHVLLCSDGLIKTRRRAPGHFVEPREIVEILSDSPGSDTARLLVDKALERKTDDNVSVIVIEAPGRLPVPRIPRTTRLAFLTALVLGLILLAVYVPRLRQPPAAPTLPPIEISQDQAYISEVQDTALEFIPNGSEPRAAAAGEFIDFVPGAVLRTGPSETGYIFVGLPGRAELFIAPNSEVQMVSSDTTGVVLQLQAGRLIINLQDDFPQERRLTVYSSSWARTWVSSSAMCLWYEPETEIFNLDCVADSCGYDDGEEKIIEAGYHVQFAGAELSSVAPGIQPAMCQFVPGLVPPSTPTVTPSPVPPTRENVVPSLTPIGWTPTPKLKETHTPTRTWTPRPTFTRTPSSTPTPSDTPTPSITPSPTPSDTPTPIPTNTFTLTPSFTPSLTPSDTPTATDTPTPPPTATATPTPPPTLQPTDTATPTLGSGLGGTVQPPGSGLITPDPPGG